MATFFKNKILKEVGTTSVQIFQTTEISRATVIGLSVTNLIEGLVNVSVTVTDDTSTTGFYCKSIPIAPNSSLRLINGGEKLVLAPSNELRIYCDQEEACDVVVSLVEIV